MKLGYFSVAERNEYKIKIRSQLICKILLNIMVKCAYVFFYTTREPHLPMEKMLSLVCLL